MPLPTRSFSAVLILAGFLAGLTASAQTGATSGPEKQQVLWQKLENSIADVDRGLDGAMGVAILDLTDGHKFLLHPNDVFPQASSIKICLLAELYRQAQQGNGAYDVTAISFHAFPYIQEKYALMSCGGSVGDGYGPMIVSTRPFTQDEIKTRKIAVPGKLTTAYLALELFAPGIEVESILRWKPWLETRGRNPAPVRLGGFSSHVRPAGG